ncbi:small ribosomal subunit Rsm22 family protein [Leptospirillum ferriphilum]|uniref:small ribosomal subunit Rsm22 family protein n=1 Tax=Leptospirillum ferriphilum TaxID=178606 RepID=UPI0006B1B168|nr:small ribosomal subunit Rsm22 family protein [Leptospirillum ferriphilum]
MPRPPAKNISLPTVSGKPGDAPVSSLQALFRGFIDHRPDPAYMDRPESLSSYLFYYHPLTSAKGIQLGEEAFARADPSLLNLLLSRQTLRMMDWGTGTGGFAEGVIKSLLPMLPENMRLEIRLLDRSREALTVAEKIVGALLADRGVVRPEILHLPRLPRMEEPVDFLLQANVLAEQTDEKEGGVDAALEAGFDHLSEGGLLLLAEPADRISSRRLLEVRDRLLKTFSGVFQILAPCPNGNNAPCPALRDERDWCHEDRPFSFPPEILRKAREIGHIRDSLKMTYLIAQKGNRSPAEHFTKGFRSLRLVSEIRKERGMVWGIFCDGESRHRLRLLLRHESEKNHFFLELSRGEEVRIGPLEKLLRRGPFLDLGPETPVERLSLPHSSSL